MRMNYSRNCTSPRLAHAITAANLGALITRFSTGSGFVSLELAHTPSHDERTAVDAMIAGLDTVIDEPVEEHDS